VKGGLHEPYAGSAVPVRSIHHRLHELTADSGILQPRIDSDRADAVYYSLLCENVAAHNPAIAFGHHGIEAWSRKHHRKQPDTCLRPGQIAGKSMRRADRGESVIANLSARWAVFCCGGSNGHVRLCI
jgi:hypothetical protein